jgi:hypothetical protein
VRQAEKRHCDLILAMLMKSDPYALPTSHTLHEERQRNEGLAQQKISWLDEPRTAALPEREAVRSFTAAR